MREAYFAVGEPVILQSVAFPESSGDAVVLSREYGTFEITTTNDITEGWAYRLTIESPSGNPWCETALRKKHKPGDISLEDCLSIDSLMENTEGEFI